MTLTIPNNKAAIRITRTILNIVKPPPILSISEWADKFRRLSPEASSEAGVWNTARAEYQRGIMIQYLMMLLKQLSSCHAPKSVKLKCC